ncbi:MAG TPA: YbaB/EbfC family nucleoid-associated protein [Candidatus Limnocylindrales bacterium]
MSESDYERIARETAAALEQVGQHAASLAAQEVSWRGADGQIIVRANAGGTITALTLAGPLLRRHDSAALSKLVAEALRSAQIKARNEFEEAFRDSVPEQVREADRLVRESVRE